MSTPIAASAVRVEAGGDGVGQPRAVQVHRQAVGLGQPDQRRELVRRIDRAVLGGVGQRQRAGRLAVGDVRLRQRLGQRLGIDAP
jgi:hypothetical protein